MWFHVGSDLEHPTQCSSWAAGTNRFGSSGRELVNDISGYFLVIWDTPGPAACGLGAFALLKFVNTQLEEKVLVFLWSNR